MTDEEIRAKIAAITIDLNKAFLQIIKKHGLDKMERGRCTFTDDGFQMKISGVFSGGDSSEMAKLRANTVVLGLKDSAVGAVINLGGEHYELIGMKQKNLVLRKGEKNYIASIDNVVAAIKRNHPDLVL